MKPMLAATIKELYEIKYPVYASPKLDGIRGVIIDGQLRSRSLKPIPNPFVSARFSKKEYDGLDGELILGSPTAHDVYRVSNGACARETGTPDVNLYVFDYTKDAYSGFAGRLSGIQLMHDDTSPNIIVLYHALIKNEDTLLEYESMYAKEMALN